MHRRRFCSTCLRGTWHSLLVCADKTDPRFKSLSRSSLLDKAVQSMLKKPKPEFGAPLRNLFAKPSWPKRGRSFDNQTLALQDAKPSSLSNCSTHRMTCGDITKTGTRRALWARSSAELTGSRIICSVSEVPTCQRVHHMPLVLFARKASTQKRTSSRAELLKHPETQDFAWLYLQSP